MTTSMPPSASGLPAAKTRARPRWPLLVAGAAVLGLIGYMVLGNANSNLVYYVLPSEYRQDEAKFAGKTLRLGGLAKDVVYNRDTLALRFNMTDGQASFPVQYRGAVPDLFRNDAVVVMEGRMQGGVFQGNSLLVKHSEEYKAGDSQPKDPAALKTYLEQNAGSAKP